MNKYAIIFIVIFFALVSIAGTSYYFNSCKKPETIYQVDTLTVERYHTEVKRDTVVKWYERLIYKEVKPETIYVEKVDSVFIKQTLYKDLMLKLSKKGNTVKVFAVNLNDSLLKEYTFADVGENFSATSTTGNIFLKSQKFGFNGCSLFANYNLETNKLSEWKKGDYEMGVETGINYLNKFYLNPRVFLGSLNKNVNLGIELKYKVF